MSMFFTDRARAAAACVLACLAVPAGAAPFVYVSNSQQDSVTVYDAPTRSVFATVPVGHLPFTLAVSRDGQRVVVGNQSGSISIIETAGHTVIATLQGGNNPYGVAINPASTRAYVANYGSSNVTVVDLVSNTVIKTIAAGLSASGVAVNPQGTKVYVSNGGANTISVIDTATDTVSKTISDAGTSPWGIAFSPDGTRAYVANYSGGTVTAIDAVADTVIAHWTAGTNPIGVAVSGDGGRVYVANSVSDTVSIIDTTAGFLLNNLPIGRRPYGVATDPDGRTLYVTNVGDPNIGSTLAIFDGLANVVVAQVPMPLYSGTMGAFVSPPTPPGIPTNVSAAPGNGKATVSFAAPVSDGGSPVTGYTATCGSQSQNGSASPIVVASLSNGVSVACRVYASNALGRGADSAPVSVTPGAVPGAPTLLSATPGNGVVDVAFTPPASDGGSPIQGYVATCGSMDQAGAASPLRVAGLTNGIAVTCHVVASNGIGTSAPSAESAPATPFTVPGAPALQSAVRSGDGADLTFGAPADSGGAPVDSYTASCTPGAASASGVSPLHVSGLDPDTPYQCSVAAHNAAGMGSASNSLDLAPRPAVDLAIAVDNGTDYVQGGSDVVYAIGVSNVGGAAVTGAHIVGSSGGELQSPTWLCSGSGGGVCPSSGTGEVDFVADLPAGARLLITLHGHVAALPENALSLSAGVSVPATYRDTDATNNAATDGPDIRGIFRSRFE